MGQLAATKQLARLFLFTQEKLGLTRRGSAMDARLRRGVRLESPPIVRETILHKSKSRAGGFDAWMAPTKVSLRLHNLPSR